MQSTEDASAIAVKVVVPGLPTPLYYTVGEHRDVDVGSQVTVELGRRTSSGWVVGCASLSAALREMDAERSTDTAQLALFSTTQQRKLKPILEAYDAFSKEQLSLFEWMAEYYGASLAEVIENALPRKQELAPRELFQISARGRSALADEEWVEKFRRRARLQSKILAELAAQTSAVESGSLAALGSSVRQALRSLVELGLVEQISDDLSFFTESESALFAKERPQQLTGSQQAALERITQAVDGRQFSPMLLFGVTGSGKTEVYLRAIEHVLAAGGAALVIVPEIALTPQLTDQFRSRLKVPLAVLHSQVGTAPRWGAWEGLLKGRIRVAIGARSAVFAPLSDLRLVIVDEEHESSYKQSDGLRYHGRDVAIMRAKLAGCPVVLGSATPSFESLLNAMRSRYTLLELPERATSRPVPQIEIVDLAKIKRKEMPSENISPALAEALQRTLERKEQAVILYNRRGFSSYLQCSTCQEVVSCSNCSVALTYHKRRDILLCHYCNGTLRAPQKCKFCCDPRTTRLEAIEGETEQNAIGILEHRGSGTERVVDELRSLFPEARISRMDRDTVSGKDAYRKILGEMKLGQTDILVGTQMIAKGHDLPGVTLVGIIDADIGLHLPDFRAGERAFQLITQAAGRAGRGEEPGRVLVQTRQANHPTIVATATGRFRAFARYELERRKLLNYPPYGRLLRVIISGKTLDDGYAAARRIHAVLSSVAASRPDEFTILGPSPAPYEKLRSWYRFHILVKAGSKRAISELAHILNAWRAPQRSEESYRYALDVDPVEML